MLDEALVVVADVAGYVLAGPWREREPLVGRFQFNLRHHEARVVSLEDIDFPSAAVVLDDEAGLLDQWLRAEVCEDRVGVRRGDLILVLVARHAHRRALYVEPGLVPAHPHPNRIARAG